MKILLLSANFCDNPYVVYPLGMSVIAGALTSAGHEVRQFDGNIYPGENWMELCQNTFNSFAPELVGFSIRNLDNIECQSNGNNLVGQTVEIIRKLKSFFDVPWVLGGSGFSLCPDKLLELTGAEYGIVGPGEEAIIKLVNELESGNRPRQQIWTMPVTEQATPLYQKDITDFYYQQTHLLPVQTKRGCKFNCVYCTYPRLEGREIVLRDINSVIDDIANFHQNYPEAMIYFVDAVFNDPARHYHSLLKKIIDKKLDVSWTAFVTPAGLNDEDLALMAASGMIAAELGVDGACDITLTGLNKCYDFATVRKTCASLHKLGISVTASVIFGGPGETRETVMEGIENLRSLQGVYSVIYAGIRLINGMPLMETAIKNGLVPVDWDGISPLNYFAPGLDPEWLVQTLTHNFHDSHYCIYPAEKGKKQVQMIHKFGYVKWHNAQIKMR